MVTLRSQSRCCWSPSVRVMRHHFQRIGDGVEALSLNGAEAENVLFTTTLPWEGSSLSAHPCLAQREAGATNGAPAPFVAPSAQAWKSCFNVPGARVACHRASQEGAAACEPTTSPASRAVQACPTFFPCWHRFCSSFSACPTPRASRRWPVEATPRATS